MIKNTAHALTYKITSLHGPETQPDIVTGLAAVQETLPLTVQKDAQAPRHSDRIPGLKAGSFKEGGDVRQCHSSNSVVVPRPTWSVHSEWAPLANGTYFESVCKVGCGLVQEK